MAHNNIQYSEKYYDDVYEYRCGLGRPAGDPCMVRKGAKSDVGSFVAGTLCCPLRLRNTYPRTVCCQRYCCSCKSAVAAVVSIWRGSATWLLSCCRTNGGALVFSSPVGGSTMPSTGQSLISCCSGATTTWTGTIAGAWVSTKDISMWSPGAAVTGVSNAVAHATELQDNYAMQCMLKAVPHV